jgi:hypothetical protein
MGEVRKHSPDTWNCPRNSPGSAHRAAHVREEMLRRKGFL